MVINLKTKQTTNMTKEAKNQKKLKTIEYIISKFIIALGENPKREGLRGTPKRIAKMYQELLCGYQIDPKTIFKKFDNEKYEGLIVISNIKFYSLCEHHMIPFFGKIHIGYVPNGKILGLSKFSRLVEIFARRLQVQERFTNQIAESLMKYLRPKGVIIYSEAEHLCISMRGVKKDGILAKAIVKRGIFKTNKELVNQFLDQI